MRTTLTKNLLQLPLDALRVLGRNFLPDSEPVGPTVRHGQVASIVVVAHIAGHSLPRLLHIPRPMLPLDGSWIYTLAPRARFHQLIYLGARHFRVSAGTEEDHN